MASQFSKIKSSSNFFDVVLFLLSSLVTRPSFMPISSLALELWSFPFIRDWPEIRKWEIPPSEICPMSGDWGELGIPNLARISLTKCYWMLQNCRVTTLSVSELLSESQQGIKLRLPPPLQPWLGLSISSVNVAKSAENRGFGHMHWRNP